MEERTIWELIGDFYESCVFVYGLSLLLLYAALAVLSALSIRRYLRRNSYTDYNLVLESPLAPGVSIIAPAFNESVTIVMNVRSLLTLNYPKFEVIIVNDGSKDDTLEKMINEFSLVEVDYAYNPKINCKPVKRVFKSTDPAYDKLVVVDKVNGGSKADGSNAGINVASYPYFICTDVDCILHKDTISMMVKPFMDENLVRESQEGLHHHRDGVFMMVKPFMDENLVRESQEANGGRPKRVKKVIATGATLRMVNSCDVEEGLITRVRPPRRLLPRFQEMEYIRAYMLGKMGWDRINAIPNVSGGLGMFDTDVAIKAGGYDSKSFAEDMDMVTRMAAVMKDNNMDYALKYVPYTLCWTEGPTTMKIFSRQRTRWARGMAQLMSIHRKIIFNPRYGRMGMIVYPYSLFFEFLAPLIEAIGILYYIYLISTNQINWPYALMLIVFVYMYSVMIATVSILWDQLTFRYYKTWGEVMGLCFMAFLEPIIYHPLIVFYAIRGYYFFITNRKHVWGNMQRQGFGGNKKQAAPAATAPAA